MSRESEKARRELLTGAEHILDNALRGTVEDGTLAALRAIGYALVAIGYTLNATGPAWVDDDDHEGA